MSGLHVSSEVQGELSGANERGRKGVTEDDTMDAKGSLWFVNEGRGSAGRAGIVSEGFVLVPSLKSSRSDFTLLLFCIGNKAE